MFLNGNHSRGLIKTRVAVDGQATSEVIGITQGNADGARGHMDCMEIVRDQAIATAEPIVKVTHPLAKVTYESAFGTVGQKQLETLLAHGLSPEQAIDVVITGMLRQINFVNELHLQGILYVPGCAQGKLQRHIPSVSADDILIAPQHALESLAKPKPAGLIVIDGAPFSHTMIQLISLGMPIVIISAQQAEQLHDGIYIQLDGASGDIQQGKASQSTSCKIPDIPVAGEPLKSADGIDVYLRASVSNVAGSTNALTYGATAIGLVRSEFFQPSSGNAPDTAFYTHVFTDICESATPLPVTIRLLDLAPDKQPSWLQQIRGMQGPLGLQGVRLYNNKSMRQIVEAQITAVDKLATYFKLKLIIPYITTLNEFRHWRNIIQQRMTQSIAIGAMAETPAALLDIRNWLNDADFIAIGTNDLMQAACEAAGKIHKVQVCGLLAQMPGILPLLLAMGYRKFSVESTRIPYLAQTIKETNIAANTQRLVEQVCAASNTKTVCKLLGVLVATIWLDS